MECFSCIEIPKGTFCFVPLCRETRDPHCVVLDVEAQLYLLLLEVVVMVLLRLQFVLMVMVVVEAVVVVLLLPDLADLSCSQVC